ncbi:hypothetical protein HOE04_03850 [archaeon]|jgi:hypothetical protein|nr:hypothetical protein [archaeon]
MDKVKTYTMGLIKGFPFALEGLDKKVNEDSDFVGAEIIDVTDNYYIVAGAKSGEVTAGDQECLSRRVLYRLKDEGEGVEE